MGYTRLQVSRDGEIFILEDAWPHMDFHDGNTTAQENEQVLFTEKYPQR